MCGEEKGLLFVKHLGVEKRWNADAKRKVVFDEAPNNVWFWNFL